ncbi:MAG: glycoside hydrolase family 2 TIM barrel-domain containing protein, partial [Candidatus Dormiibacterota bacterium]
RVEITTHLRNLDGREMPGEVVLDLHVPPPDAARPGPPPLRLRRSFTMPGGSERTVKMTMTVPEARPWSPWRTGRQTLYRATATVRVRDEESVRWEDQFGFRDVVLQAGSDGWSASASGQPMFLRGANYLPNLRLDELDEETFRADLQLAKEANLDLLRVHGHVLPDEFYRLADEVGMLVVADFPLTLSYAYHASAEETKFFEHGVRAQVPEMILLLCNRPSIVLWVAHDDPPWIASNAALGDVHAVRQNYTIDQEIKATIEHLDPTRPVLAASGELDQHLWLGWREGSWHHFGEVLPTFVTEFGAQALPALDSPDWEALRRRWPVAADDAAWLYAGYEPPAWSEHGVGLPDDYETLDEYVDASQEYQAWLLSYAIDQLRKRKFEPCWGAVLFALTDSFPGIGFGLLDHARRARPALDAVREAFQPLRLIIDPVGFTPLVPFGVGWQPDDEITIRLVVVNDDPELEGEAEIRWTVVRDEALERGAFGRLFDSMRRKSSGGTVPLTLPTATEPALQVTSLSLPIDAEGDYTFEAELRLPGREPQTTELLFRIADRLETVRRRSLLPVYLAERIVVDGSLRQVPEGLRFTLRNRTRPAVLTGLGEVRLDGGQVPEPRLLLETDGARIPVPRRVELPVDRDVEILLELTRRLEPGEHELEVDLTLPGIASGRVRVRGRTAEEETV